MKSVGKKTTGKKKTKSVTKRKTAVVKRPVSKKPFRKQKSAPKKEMTVKTPERLFKRTASKKSEEERQAALRRTLIKKREEIVKEAKTEISKYIKGETRQLVDTALDDGDWSVVDLSEDISLRRLATHRETLLKIDEALRKLNEGTYGLCEDCGEEISKERLKILPFATYCIDCQERREQFEEMEKREGLLS